MKMLYSIVNTDSGGSKGAVHLLLPHGHLVKFSTVLYCIAGIFVGGNFREKLASYPGHVGGGKSGLVFEVQSFKVSSKSPSEHEWLYRT